MGKLYLDCLGGGLPPKGGMAVGGGSSLQGAIGRGAGLGCGSSKGYNFGLIISLLSPAFPCPFQNSTGWIIL